MGTKTILERIFQKNFTSVHVYSRSFLYLYFDPLPETIRPHTGTSACSYQTIRKKYNVFCSKFSKVDTKKKQETLTFSCFIYLFFIIITCCTCTSKNRTKNMNIR